MIELRHLTKRYGAKAAIEDLSLTVEKGEIVGFLGPNGAGKSTTMNILTGYISATDGSAVVDGFDVLEHPNEVKKRIGYLPEQPPLYPDMTVREYLSFVFDLKKVDKDKAQHLTDCMTLVKLDGVQNRRIKNLSKGYKQRVGLAEALLGNPEILILDEPTVGLDPKQILEIRDMIRKLGKNHTVILSSHIMQEISAVCERVIIIAGGRMVVDSKLSDLENGAAGEVSVTVRAAREEAEEVLASIPEGTVVRTNELPQATEIILRGERDLREDIFFAFAKAGKAIIAMKPVGRSLEEVFLRATAMEETGEEEEA